MYYYSTVGDDEVLNAEQRILSAKVIRLNLSELYQYLNAASILQQMVDGKLIQPQKKNDAESYSSKYPQNHVATMALFNMESPSTFLFHLCDILDPVGVSQQRELALKLRAGLTTLLVIYTIHFTLNFILLYIHSS